MKELSRSGEDNKEKEVTIKIIPHIEKVGVGKNMVGQEYDPKM